MKYINKKYLLTFVAVTLLNIALAAFLIHNSFGQTNKSVDQKTLSVEVVTQNGSPLQVSVINVDNTAESHQGINYIVQNVSPKKIGAYVLLHTDESGAGRTTINFFQSLTSGQSIQNSIFVERANVKPKGKVSLSFDYVLFEDGSFWGKDSQQQSDYIFGQNEGQKKAVEQIKQFLTAQNKVAVSNLLKQQITELNPPYLNNKKTAKWQNGFVVGYRSVLSKLQLAYEKQGIEAVPLKLEEIEKFTKREEK